MTEITQSIGSDEFSADWLVNGEQLPVTFAPYLDNDGDIVKVIASLNYPGLGWTGCHLTPDEGGWAVSMPIFPDNKNHERVKDVLYNKFYHWAVGVIESHFE